MTRVPTGSVTGYPSGGLPTRRPAERWLRWLVPVAVLLAAGLWRSLPSRQGGRPDVASGPTPSPASTKPPWAPVGYTPVALPDPGPCAARPRPELLVILEDDSGSTTRSDPSSRRYPESAQVLEWMAKNRCHQDDQVAIVHFARTASHVGPERLDGGLPALQLALAAPDLSVGSDATVLGPAVDLATAMARERPGHRATLVIASDGQVNDPGAAMASVAAFPGEVHVVALGGALPSLWSTVKLAGVQQLDSTVAPGDVAQKLVDIWITTTRRAASQP